MVKKTIILLIISMFLLSGLASADFEFTEEDKNLGFLDSLRLLFSTQKLFTAAGEQRQCSVNPDETGYIASNQIPFTISCSGQVALINLYNINSNGGWDYFVEVEAPYTITFQPSYLTRAYECYYCPEIVNSCSSGEERCVTENTNQVCQNGQWSSTRTCPSGQKCGLSGSCENVEVIDPLWNCADWGECVNNVQERHCWDARNTGKLDNKPPTSRACTPTESTTTTTLCDKTAIYPEEGRICCQNFLGGYGSKIGGSCYLTKEVPIDECRQAICENKAVVIAGSGPGDTTTTTLGPSADNKCLTPLKVQKETGILKGIIGNLFGGPLFGSAFAEKLTGSEGVCATPLTKDQIKSATDFELLQASCKEDNNCNPKKDYTVDCVNPKTAGLDSVSSNQLISININVFGEESDIEGICLAESEGEDDADFEETFTKEYAGLALWLWLLIGVGAFLLLGQLGGGKK